MPSTTTMQIDIIDSALAELDKDVLDNVPVHVSQPEITTLKAIGQSFVVDPHQVQDRCLEIMDVDRIFDRLVAEFVGRPVR